MKKVVVLLAVVCLSCKSSYQKADEALEVIKREQYSLDSLFKFPEYSVAVKKAKNDADKGVQVYVGESPLDAFYSTDYVNYLKANGSSYTANLIEEISRHQVLIVAYKSIFNRELDKVTDQGTKMKLIQKYDRVYVLRIEK